MSLLYIFLAAVVAFAVFQVRRGTRAVSALERGEYGPFKVTRSSGSGESYIAVDAEARKLALVNVDVPSFNASEQVTGFSSMTVVFSFEDLASVSATRNGEVTSLVFSFTKPVPSWNIRRQLTFHSDDGVRTFLERYAPDIKVGYFRANQYGGVDPWS